MSSRCKKSPTPQASLGFVTELVPEEIDGGSYWTVLFGKFRLPWNTESCRVRNLYSLFLHVKPSPFFWRNIQFLVILTTSFSVALEDKKLLGIYPVWLFYCAIAWMILLAWHRPAWGGFPRTMSLDFWSTTMVNYCNSKDLAIRSQKLPVICSGHPRQRLDHSGLLPCSAVVNDWSENRVTASGKVEYCRTRFWNGWFFSIPSGFCRVVNPKSCASPKRLQFHSARLARRTTVTVGEHRFKSDVLALELRLNSCCGALEIDKFILVYSSLLFWRRLTLPSLLTIPRWIWRKGKGLLIGIYDSSSNKTWEYAEAWQFRAHHAVAG